MSPVALELAEHTDRPLIPAFKWLKRNKALPDVGLEQPVGHIGGHPDSATGDWNWSLPGTKCAYVFFLKFLNLFNFCVDRDIRQLFENLSLFPELCTRSLYVKPQECQWEPFGLRISCKWRAWLEAVTLTYSLNSPDGPTCSPSRHGCAGGEAGGAFLMLQYNASLGD